MVLIFAVTSSPRVPSPRARLARQASFLIGQRDRSAIIFKLRHNLERLIQGADRTIIKISDLILGVRITQRKHRIFMYYLLKLFREVAPHPPGRGESGSANSGCAASSSCNSFIILSNSKSDIVGAEKHIIIIIMPLQLITQGFYLCFDHISILILRCLIQKRISRRADIGPLRGWR